MYHIAILDNTFYIRNRIRDLMHDMDTELIEASTKKQLIKMLEVHKNVDLIILEIDLPNEEDGFEVLKDIRAIQNEVPIIILTSENKRTTFVRGIQEGASDYILKPFDDAFLIRRIKEHLKRKRAIVQKGIVKEHSMTLSVDFQSYLDMELKKALKGQYEVTLLITLFFKNVENLTPRIEKEYHKVSEMLLPILKENIFETDLLLPYGSQSFIGVFPFCSIENQHFVRDKFEDAFEKLQIEYPFLDNYSLLNTFVTFPKDGNTKNTILDQLTKDILKKVEEHHIQLSDGPLRTEWSTTTQDIKNEQKYKTR